MTQPTAHSRFSADLQQTETDKAMET